MFRGKFLISIMLALILIVTIFPLIPNSKIKADVTNLSILNNHNTIHINGNSQFTISNGVMTGSGIAVDPYIIENWIINTTYNHGIWVENTNAYFLITNCFIHNNTNQSSNYHGIYFDNVENGTIENSRIIFNDRGIYFNNSHNNNIKNNTIANNIYGLRFSYSKNNEIYENSFNLNTYGGIIIRIYSSNNKIVKNELFFNGDDDISIVYYSSNNEIYDNLCINNKHDGIGISRHCENNMIFNNTISNTDRGISINECDSNYVINNTCLNNSIVGIFITFSSDSNSVINNIVANNNKGIYIEQKCYSNVLINNTVENNSNGIYIEYKANLNTIANNTIRFNKFSGINITSYNRIHDFTPCKNNTIYNNYFNNSNNFDVDVECTNIWNISKTAGKNIIGGPYLGGNFWSDYLGKDINDDGLGDTNIPHGPGDYLPLMDIFPPEIIDNTTGIPTTGDEFVFEANAWDNIIVRSVHVEYKFDDGSYNNLTMNRTIGDFKNGNYSKVITVPANALRIYFNLSVVDIGSNWVATSIKTLEVIDNDAPTIIDQTISSPTTGENYTLKAEVTDNINTSEIYMKYWLDNDNPTNITLDLFGENCQENISIGSNDTILNYIFSAMDNSSNWASTGILNKNIIDNDRPIIKDLCGIPTTGDNYSFVFQISDNIDVDVVYLEYWFDDNIRDNITLPENNTYSIKIPLNAFDLNAKVTVLDTSNNIDQLSIIKQILDNDSPTIKDLTTGQPETGNEFSFEVGVTDNYNIRNVSIEYWFDEGDHVFDNLVKNNDNYVLEIIVPNDAMIMNYIIKANDTNNNSANIENNLDVKDIIPPDLTDLTEGDPTTGDDFVIKASAEDNIGIESLYLEYWFDDNGHIKLSFEKNITINVPIDATSLDYVLSAYDLSGNYQEIIKEKAVMDNDLPLIIDNVSEPTTGDDLTFKATISDNINVISSYLEYWFDNNEHVKINFEGVYETYVPSNARKLYYNFSAEDGNNNIVFVKKEINVIDNDMPFILDFSPKTATTGDIFNATAMVEDNILLSDVTIEYWFDIEHFKSDMKLAGGNYSKKIQIPDNATDLSYKISAIDTSGNNHSIEKTIEVIDNDKPVIEDYSYKTDMSYIFSVDVQDNIGVFEVKVDYRFNNSDSKIKILKLNYDKYEGSISIPNNIDKLYYTISTMDLEGNKETTMVKEIDLPQEQLITPTSPPSTKSEEESPWALMVMILLMITIVIAIIVGYYYNSRKKRKNKEKEVPKTIEITQHEQQMVVKDKSQEILNETVPLPKTEKSTQLTQEKIPK